jgi:hypothetical protein
MNVLGQSQNPVRAGALPAVNLSMPVNSLWKVQLNAEHRAIQLEEHRRNAPAPDWGWEAERLDLSVFASRRYRIDQSFAGGYMIRFSERGPIHRLRQQWTRVFREYNFRWAYRMAADQTFVPDAATIYRWRHRFTVEVPLSGQVVDAREFYFKANNEYLFIFRDQSPQWESRWVPLLGYTFSDRNKVEAGVDYRRESRAENPALHSFWWTVQWYVAL